MIKNNKDKNILLSSNSPRLKELLLGLGVEFESRTREVEENYPEDLDVEKVAPYLSDLKAQAWEGEVGEQDLILTSDTVVILAGQILGKPRSREEGVEMLRQISGKKHRVGTGVTLLSAGKKMTFSDSTDVTFSRLEEEEIVYYMNHFHPLDKAGSYGAQDFIGFIGIEKLEGSYFNVMGLPVHKLWNVLKNF